MGDMYIEGLYACMEGCIEFRRIGYRFLFGPPKGLDFLGYKGIEAFWTSQMARRGG